MPLYQFQGINKKNGKAAKGSRDADNEKALRSSLKKEGILVTEIVEKGKKKNPTDVDFQKFFAKRVKREDIALITRQLATLTGAGISLVESISAVIEQTENPELKSAMVDVREQVNQGTSLAESFRRHPKYFDYLYCNMVHAGEQSGTLEQVLDRLAGFIDASNKLRSKIIAAMAYPGVMAAMGLVVIGVLMVVVVPKVTTIFDNFDRELPWFTRALIFISDFMSSYWWLVLILMGASIFGFMKWKKSEKGKFKWHGFVLKAPIFGALAMMVSVSRFAKTLSTLLASGVPLLTAMDITKGVLGNSVLEKVIVEASSSIREGESIAGPLKASGFFPPIVTHMIAVGEQSGQLEHMLENVADSYDGQVDIQVATLTSLLEPLMIIVMGLGAGGIAAAILYPLIQMNEFVM